MLQSYAFMLAWHMGAIGWLANLDSGIVALLANSIIYSIPLALIFFIPKRKKIIVLIPVWLLFEVLINTVSFSTPLITIGNALSTQIYLIQWYKYSTVIGGSFWMLLLMFLFYKYNYFYFFALLIVPICISLLLYNDENEPNNDYLNITVFNSEFLNKNKVLKLNRALYTHYK